VQAVKASKLELLYQKKLLAAAKLSQHACMKRFHAKEWFLLWCIQND